MNSIDSIGTSVIIYEVGGLRYRLIVNTGVVSVHVEGDTVGVGSQHAPSYVHLSSPLMNRDHAATQILHLPLRDYRGSGNTNQQHSKYISSNYDLLPPDRLSIPLLINTAD